MKIVQYKPNASVSSGEREFFSQKLKLFLPLNLKPSNLRTRKSISI